MNMLLKRLIGSGSAVVLLLALTVATPALAQEQEPELTSPKQVADLVRDRVLDGEFGDRTLWMTERPLDDTHVARDLVVDRSEDLRFPYPRTWLVMIDEYPDANFAHPVRWLFVDADTGTVDPPIDRDFPPVVLSEGGSGPAVEFRCVPVTPTACPEVGLRIPDEVIRPPGQDKDCLYAVLVSGGISNAANYSRYPQNLKSMYQILRGCGYPKSNIFVFYADGRSLDLDNADGDNDDSTGSDVTGGANEAPIRAKIQDLCRTLNPKKDVLFTYFTNHGADDTGVCLWDNGNDGLQAGELYSPAELASDTADCQVCRHFMIHDQCFAGDFLPMAGDGDHDNLAVYAAASATEFSWGREYMAQWETNDPAVTTINAMHQDVVNNGNLTSTPGKAEGTAGLGDVSLCECCKKLLGPWWWWWIVLVVIVIVVIWWWTGRRRRTALAT